MSLELGEAASRERRQALWLLALTALALRLPLLLGAPGADYDLESYRLAAGSPLLKLYTDEALQGRYPYLPGWWLVLKLCQGFSAVSGLAFERVVRLPGLAADLAVSLLLHRLLERLTASRALVGRSVWNTPAFWGALAWAASPLSALITAGHGQFDSLPLFLLLLAAWQLEFSSSPRSELNAALALGAAMSLKPWALAFLPFYLKTFLERREMLRFSLQTLCLPTALLLPWLAMDGPVAVAGRLAYSGASTLSLPEALKAALFASGASAQVYQGARLALGALGLAVLASLALAYLAGPWRFPLLPGLALGALTLLVAAPALSVQYLSWPACLALLSPGPLARRLQAVGLAAALGVYLFLLPGTLAGSALPAPPQTPGSLLLWAGANLGLWMFLAVEWARQLGYCRRLSVRF